MIDIRRWRRQPRQWLLVRPGEQDSPWSWQQVEAGQVLRAGQGQPPQDGSYTAVLIVPGSQCGHFHVPAPTGLKREEWPLLLEDHLLQEPETVHTGCVSRQPGWLELVIVERQRLAQWLAVCAGWGLNIERCWTEFQLLPDPALGSAWCWQREPDLSLFKGCTAEQRQVWLAWPPALGAAPPLWADLRIETFEGAWPTQLSTLERLPSVFELPRKPLPRLNLARGPRWLLAGCVLLGVLWSGLWLNMQWRQSALYQAQVVQVVGPVATPRQAAQALKRQRQAQDEQLLRLRRLESLQGAVAQWLAAHPNWRLRLARFDGARWTLHMRGPDVPADSPWADMAAGAGAQVVLEPAAANELRMVFDLQAGA